MQYKNIKNCEKCLFSYSPYSNESFGEYVCCLSFPNVERKGLCPFCNPKCWLYLNETLT